MNTWKVDATKILSRSEIGAVLVDVKRRGNRRSSINTRQNLVIFRLATCCGLRASELCGLKISHVVTGVRRPYLNVPKAIAKGRKGRRVPLWWDAGTLADLESWKAERERQGAGPGDLFICSQSRGSFGKPLTRQNARVRYISTCRVLGSHRQAEITIHHGRHSFVSHALAAGRTLAEVRDAAGHSSVGTTSIYTHVATEDDGAVGNIFGFDDPSPSRPAMSRDDGKASNAA